MPAQAPLLHVSTAVAAARKGSFGVHLLNFAVWLAVGFAAVTSGLRLWPQPSTVPVVKPAGSMLSGTPYTYLPVCRGSEDRILGVLSLPVLLQRQLLGEAWDIEALLKPVLFAPIGLSPLALLDLFRERREHLALVVDEYGEVQGLVTLTDVLEAMVGEMPGNVSDNDPDVVHREDGSWLLDGALSIERFRDLFPLECEDLEASRDFQTLAGLILFELGSIPRTGEVMSWQSLRMEIVDMDGMRIDKVLVSRPGRNEH